MDRKLLFVSMLLLLSAIPYAAPCPSAVRTIHLAAVTGEETGGIFQLQVETRPGSGTIYTAVSPKIGFSTQESEEIAANYAFGSTGIPRRECDVLYSIYGDFGTNSVDGPSAGAAMAVATRAALLNRTIRQDVVITGTVSEGGKVGEVGGIIEKSLAASDSGARYMLLPKFKVHEALLLSSISRSRDFSAIEISNVSDAEKVLFSPLSENFSSQFKPESREIPSGLQSLEPDLDIKRFSKVAEMVVDDLGAKVENAFEGKSGEDATLREYFRREIAKYRKLLSMGYVFTAANAAFLLSIDAEYVKIGETKVDLDGSIQDVGACVKALEPEKKTRQNFHWAVGSDLRRLWAAQKLNETVENRAGQGGYTTLRDLFFAYSWCGISRELAKNAQDIGGETVDESSLSELAQQKLASAEEALSTASTLDYDALWHYDAGVQANKSGNFGAAIYEAAYALTMQKISSENGQNTTEAAEKLMIGNRSSLWGKVYYGQGAYLYADATSGGFTPTDAYRILKYSSEIDKASNEIDRELLKKGNEKKTAQPASGAKPALTDADPVLAVILAGCVTGFGLAVVYRIAKDRGRGV